MFKDKLERPIRLYDIVAIADRSNKLYIGKVIRFTKYNVVFKYIGEPKMYTAPSGASFRTFRIGDPMCALDIELERYLSSYRGYTSKPENRLIILKRGKK